jgi:FAD/FMN-containing dehydrogenase
MARCSGFDGIRLQSRKMNRRAFLKSSAAVALLPLSRRGLFASSVFRRQRPGDARWPSKEAWKRLNDAVGGNLLPVDFPIAVCTTGADRAECRKLFESLKNPYFIGDQPGVSQTLGWVDAWTTQPSVYAVAARNSHDIAEAVNFARDNNLRLVVKGGGHSYQGTSNAPDSLLIWTRHMNGISMHPAFVPQGCEHTLQPQSAVTLGAGTIWMQAYGAVTTRGAKYVQGGGCTTVGVAGLIQSGGFGSHSKHYGTAAGSLLEAEIVTADGQIRTANACTNPDLFWALKGGGGGSFGVVSSVTLRAHDLPEFFGAAVFTVKAASDDSYRRLIRQFVSFYHDHLFNDHWGEQAHVNSDNTLVINMVFQGLDAGQATKAWQPFLDWLARAPHDYSIDGRVTIGTIAARGFWNVESWKEHWPELVLPNLNGSTLVRWFDDALGHLHWQPVFNIDPRPGAGPNDAWWKGDGGQVGWFIWGFESLWLPASLLENSAQERLADALFASSRHTGVELHFNKGLAGAPPDAIARATDTATNPAVLTAFALAIASDAQGSAYPGIAGHEPSVAEGRKSAERIGLGMNQLRALVPNPGAYVSESNYFEKGWQEAYWGSNYPRLAKIKRKYDPDGLFFVHNGVGSEQWSADGFTKI